ncbi:hypothetical protein SAMN05216489_00554 [Streptomyces sp. 3213]|uniref:nuclear transport factor 2 family protein n=1 Tax=Streptomyces sp. 3213.3 TaxID=1855348 RepID=UPI0008947DA0|nr:nuclear transport factor 2 family protein [Streptomyces sp. 3213.3]SEC36909.1 hypothetical protein SAMN05216489_00554 [Streptomyces sp. 3213] [Streptomyces sp. 3213.3]
MESLDRRTLLGAAAAVVPLAVLPALASPAAASTEASQPAGSATYPHAAVLPNVLETSHAARETAALIHAYYTAKSRYDIDAFIDFFNPGQMAYFDSPLHIGGVFPTRDVFRDQIMGPTLEGWSKTGGKSYPLRVIGDATSAVVLFRNTPELFGNEVRIISSFTFEHGKIVRVLDYWDGRRNDEALKNRPPNTDNPRNLGTEIVRESADPAIKTFARHLGSALAASDVDSAAALFSDDALFEDMTTRTTIVGRPAIGRYLTRALSRLPYGPGSEVLHVLGGKQGGGYEWVTHDERVPNGITALQLDRVSDYKHPDVRTPKITRLTTVWDASLLPDSTVQSLAALSIEP